MARKKRPVEKCIYCPNQGNDFPREHVLSEALGHFKGALTIRSVCGKCNAYFANNLERDFYRDSSEAVLRLIYGIKPPAGALQLGKTRMELHSAVVGDFYGCYLVLQPGPTGEDVIAVPEAQAAFRIKGEPEWMWLREREINSETITSYRVPNAEYKATGPTETDGNRIMTRLETLGLKFTNKRDLDQPMHQNGKFEVMGKFLIDEQVFRCIAKMGLNYLAYTQGAQFVMSSDFDDIRRYIRCGTGDRRQFVKASAERILAADSHFSPLTYGHLIVCDWNLSGQAILVRLSLFNHTTYTICTTSHFNGIFRPIHKGHHYDVETMTVSALRGTKLIHPVVFRPRRK